ncbi:MAG: DNA topoisomerase VI subunit B [Candidatus Thorarchaeota archaeon]|nr:MAG: DNA topoisomerase VI subunit B [Candidatus Thorarchaeota archaeon]
MSQRTDLTQHFESISPAEFFYRNRQMAGFANASQALYSAVRELVENSLDSCEDHSILPRVDISITNNGSDTFNLRVSDNGPGVPTEHVPNAFGKVLFGSKYRQRQKRGAFGLGVTMAILYGQITTDSAAVIHTKQIDSPGTEYRLLIDVEKNCPIVQSTCELHRESTGTTVSICLKGNLSRSEDRIMEYLRLTSVSSPHASLSLTIDGNVVAKFGGVSRTPPPPPSITKPHPRSVDLEMMNRLIQQKSKKRLKDWLVDSFQKVGVKTATDFLKFIQMDPNRKVTSLSRDELIRIGSGLRKYDKFENPDSRALSPIGKSSFIVGVRSAFNTSAQYYSVRTASEWHGHPLIIEGILVIGDDFPRSDIPTLYRFANRVPLLYDSSEDVLTKALKRVNWGRYNLRNSSPAALFVNLSSTRIPFKAAGKQSIASIPEIEEIAIALYRDLGRRLNKVLKQHLQSTLKTKRMREFRRFFNLLAVYGAELAETQVPETSSMIDQLFEVEDIE